MKYRKLFIATIMTVSLALNCFLGGMYGLSKFNASSGRLGILNKDLRLGEFGGHKVIFTLPKGIIVQDETPNGFAAIDLFEPHRFSIVVTSENDNLVDYKSNNLSEHENLYSADVKPK